MGNPLSYPDPTTGVLVDGLTAFRNYLKAIAPRAPSNPGLSMFKEVVHLEFSTAKPNFDGTFFSPGRWNEKIRWLSVQINAEVQNLVQLSVWLEQSGLGFIRTQLPGQPDPEHPDIMKGEMTSYPTCYWYQAEDLLTHSLRWYSKDTFGFVINASVVKDPDVPIESLRKQEFHEMPPAVSKWVLEIPLVHISGVPVIDLNKVNDVEIWFMNYYKTRN